MLDCVDFVKLIGIFLLILLHENPENKRVQLYFRLELSDKKNLWFSSAVMSH
jgi:hypothetical protein